MKEYSLSQQYAIIGFNGLDSTHASMAKNATVRSIKAAKLLEKLFSNLENTNLVKFKEIFEGELSRLKKMTKKEFQVLEKDMAASLIAKNILEEVPALLACDINYYTSGIDIKAYRSEPDLYLNITEAVRAEILEEGPITQECIALLWLFRESGCMHEIFSTKEQEIIENRMIEITSVNEIYKIIWQAEYHRNMEGLTNHFLSGKKNLFKNPYLEGMNLIYPFLERRKSIFIDFIILNKDVKDRRLAIITFLSKKGFYVEEVKNGNETFLKINNAYYRVFPKAKSYHGIPVQGASLLPVYQ